MSSNIVVYKTNVSYCYKLTIIIYLDNMIQLDDINAKKAAIILLEIINSIGCAVKIVAEAGGIYQ